MGAPGAHQGSQVNIENFRNPENPDQTWGRGEGSVPLEELISKERLVVKEGHGAPRGNSMCKVRKQE